MTDVALAPVAEFETKTVDDLFPAPVWGDAQCAPAGAEVVKIDPEPPPVGSTETVVMR